MSRILIAFYSRADENHVGGRLEMLKIGNTEIAAGMIEALTGGELFRIEQEKPYSKDYNECIAEAQADQRRGARPKLKRLPQSIDEYDVICLGYPNYWNTMPMAVFTFLESFDFSGKVILPFCTHEGSGMGCSEIHIRRLCPHSVIKTGLALRGGSINQAQKNIEQWLKEELS